MKDYTVLRGIVEAYENGEMTREQFERARKAEWEILGEIKI